MVKVASDAVDLRRGIDHIGVSVCFVIHDGKGNAFLHRRGPGARDENGNWDVGGGAIEFGESIDDAVRREIKEEFCTEPLEIKLLTAYDAHREHKGDKTHWVMLLHAALVDPKQIKIGEPHKVDATGWFTTKTLPSPLHSHFWNAFQPAIDAGIIK